MNSYTEGNNHPALGLEETVDGDTYQQLENYVQNWLIKLGYGERSTNFESAFKLIQLDLEQIRKVVK